MMSLVNKLAMLLFFIALFFVMMPIYAQNQYVFPDNINEPQQSVKHDIEPVEQYYDPSYSRDSRLTDNKFYHQAAQYVTTNKQNSYETEQLKKQRSRQLQNSQRVFISEQSEHYKYGDFNSNTFSDTQTQQAAHYPNKDFNHKRQYSARDYPDYPNQINAKPVRYLRPSVPAAHRQQRSYTGSPGPLYASDFDVDGYISNKRPVNKTPYPISGNNNNYYSGNNNNNYYSKSDFRGQNKQHQVRVQYVPVPVYNVPGTLPGTIPGVVTPANMVPGYSHLSPNYNYLNDNRPGGGYDLSGPQYNPLTGLGAFSAYSNPFNHLYKGYNNYLKKDLPFLYPNDFPSFLEQDALLP